MIIVSFDNSKYVGHWWRDSEIISSLFWNCTQIGMTPDKRPELSTNWQISGKLLQGLANVKSAYI